MPTVLLVDDDNLFKAVEGTCLRRERCRLLMAPLDGLRATARERTPDLIIATVPPSDPGDAVRRILSDRSLAAVPVILVDFSGPAATGGRDAGAAGEGEARPAREARVEFLPVSHDARGRPDFADLDGRLEAAVMRALPMLRRQIDRIPVSLPVRCSSGGLDLTLKTKDISPSGLFLKTDRPLSRGNRLSFRFTLPAALEAEPQEPREQRPQVAIAGTCEVVRQVSAGEAAPDTDADLIPGVGVRFVELGEEGRAALIEFVRSGRPAARAAHRAGTAH